MAREQVGESIDFGRRIYSNKKRKLLFLKQQIPEINEPMWGERLAAANAMSCPDSGSSFVPHLVNFNAYFACSQQRLVPVQWHYRHAFRLCAQCL